MARNLTAITAALKKAADRVAKLQWKKPVVKPTVKNLRDRPDDKGFSVRKMLRAATEFVKNNAVKGDVHVIRRQKRGTAKRRVYWFMTTTSENGQARQHVQLITVKDGAPTLSESKDLYYECDCGYWKYYCDWAAWKKGASQLKHSINEPPDEKNPRYIVHPCKHVFIVCRDILDDKL